MSGYDLIQEVFFIVLIVLEILVLHLLVPFSQVLKVLLVVLRQGLCLQSEYSSK